MADSGNILNFILSALMKKVVVPSDFHGQAGAVETMLKNDVSGLVDSLTDFACDTADVDFSIETSNVRFSRILKKWLNEINSQYNGKIPSGIKPLAKEYFKERWKGASFPVLRIAQWDELDGIIVPTKLFFVDGGSIHAKDKDETDELSLLSYNYYLGTKDKAPKLDDGCIFADYSGRWYDKYPTPYLIKRGVYNNFKIIQSLKNKETEILDQIIPYMLLVKKGTERLAVENVKSYSDEELEKVVEQFQDLMDKIKTSSSGDKLTKSPIRAVQFDEELKHIIPDLETIFKVSLFAVAERGVLSGLGFIDVISGISDTRRESILNPKVFVEEVRSGVEDFKQILKELVLLIRDKNESHIKYINSEFYITSAPISGFMDDKFRNQMRLLWERGQLSNQTYCELVGQTTYRTEKMRRKKEAKEGDEILMHPHLTQNAEDKESFEEIKRHEKFYNKKPIKKDTDKNGDPIDPDKLDDKKKYDIGKTNLETAPYTKITELPSKIKDSMSPGLQRTFLKVFNQEYRKYQSDSRAFRIAWGVIKKIAKKGKDGRWVRKTKGGKLTKAMIDEELAG